MNDDIHYGLPENSYVKTFCGKFERSEHIKHTELIDEVTCKMCLRKMGLI